MSLMWVVLCLAAVMSAVQSAPSREKKIEDLITKLLASKGLELDEASLDLKEVNKKEEEIDPAALAPEGLFERDLDEGLLPPPNSVFKKSLEVEEEKRAVKQFHINMCYYCDNNCMIRIGGGRTGVADFYDRITAMVQDMLNTINPAKYTFTTRALYKLHPGRSIPFLWFKRRNDRSNGYVLLSNVNGNFWGYQGLYDFSVSRGCDADFLTVDPADDLWAPNFVSDVSGIANMHALCTDKAFSTVKLNENKPGMAALVAHELGHMLGMFHDHEDGAYSEAQCANYESRIDASLGAPCRAVSEICDADGPRMCDPGRGNCVMSASVSGEVEFSKCSAAYFDIYVQIADIVRDSRSYDLSCIEVGNKKRGLTEETEKRGNDAPFNMDDLVWDRAMP